MSSRQPRHPPPPERERGTRRKLVTAICLLSLSLSTLLLLRTKWQLANYGTEGQHTSSKSWMPSTLMKQSTADAIASDELIRRNFLAFVEFGADASDEWASKSGSESLREASQVLRAMRDELSMNAKPQSTFGEMVQLGKRGEPNKNAKRGLLEDIADKGIQAVISAAGGSLTGVGAAAGIGVGQGTVQGLKLKSADEAKAIAADVMKESGDEPSKLSPIVVSVGSNAAAVITRSINLGNLTNNPMLAPAAMGLAMGLGNGAVNGLGLANRAPPPNSSSLVDVAGNLGYGLSDTVSSAINIQQLINSSGASMIKQQLPAGVLGLSQGIGTGAVSGLNISQVPPPSQANSDVPSLLRVFGYGLTNSVTSSIPIQNLVALIPGGAGGIMQDLPSAALNLAQGLGNGAVTGLKIANVPPPPENASVPGIAGTFGYGISNSVTSNVDVKSLVANAAGSGIASGITAQAPQIALGLGQGLGNGAVTGLKLNMVAPPNGSSPADVAGNLGYGLTQSVTSNLKLASLGSAINPQLLLDNLPEAASGLGRGLGAGVPIGLGLQPDPGPLMGPNGTRRDVGAITENFGTGLTSGFLRNGTLSKVLATTAGSGLLPKVDPGAVANGLGRGLAQGVTDAVTAMGGFNSLLNGNATVPTGPVPNTPVLFNDSLGGAAIGLGEGLGTGGALALQKVLTGGALAGLSQDLNMTKKGMKSSLPDMGAAAMSPRSVDLLDPRQPVQPAPAPAPAAMDPQPPTKLNITNLVTADTLSKLVQKGLDAMTPRGFGGLALFGQSTFKQPKKFQLERVKPFLPPGVVQFRSDGHSYALNPRQAIDQANSGVLQAVNAISVDGWTFTTLFIFISLHVTFAISGLMGFIPLAMALEAGRNIVLRIEKPHVMTKIPYRINILWLIVGFPMIIAQFVFAVVATNTAPHFKSVHGILGLLTTIIAFIAVFLHYLVRMRAPEEVPPRSTLGTIRHIANALLLVLSIATGLSGFGQLSTITVGLTQTVFFEYSVLMGFALALLIVPTVFVYLLDWALVYRARRIRKRGTRIHEEKEAGGVRDRTRIRRARTPSSSLLAPPALSPVFLPAAKTAKK
ncbi:hypothetical protein PG993_014088 [Apiospora rasikravindrae]|uniref:Cytochrome b561 domain-containing protein n=1 Tax=Apiospora rasikravindrae TaxID=990691 RepID=A0ABR1RS93_9PEZI